MINRVIHQICGERFQSNSQSYENRMLIIYFRVARRNDPRSQTLERSTPIIWGSVQLVEATPTTLRHPSMMFLQQFGRPILWRRSDTQSSTPMRSTPTRMFRYAVGAHRLKSSDVKKFLDANVPGASAPKLVCERACHRSADSDVANKYQDISGQKYILYTPRRLRPVCTIALSLVISLC